MKEGLLRRIAWFLALVALAILITSIILVIWRPAGENGRYLEILSGAIVGCGAPALGLAILRKQPGNRIGWLGYGLAISFFSLTHALKYQVNVSEPGNYPAPLFVMLMYSEMANVIRIISLMLLILWFPDGRPLSARWGFIHWWAAAAILMMHTGYFAARVRWSETEGFTAGLGNVNNPIGFLPESWTPLLTNLTEMGFFSIICMLLLAVLSIVLGYRSAGWLVRTQIQWFVLGSIVYTICAFASVFMMEYLGDLAGTLDNLAIVIFYLAIGIAITRYRLFDIDVIIRKTLVYTILIAALAFVFFGGVALLQTLFQAISGEQSAAGIVLSTLKIAGLFNPLRRRVQDFLDRRFYRRKYDAEQALASFAAHARGEMDIDQLSSELTVVVSETVQPESITLWLKPHRRARLVS